MIENLRTLQNVQELLKDLKVADDEFQEKINDLSNLIKTELENHKNPHAWKSRNNILFTTRNQYYSDYANQIAHDHNESIKQVIKNERCREFI
jgi:isoleucyl-tRNA synthetase